MRLTLATSPATNALLAAGVAFAAVIPASTPAEAAVNLIREPGLEKPGSGGLPACWEAWSEEGAQGKLSISTDAHGGSRALRLDVTGPKGAVAAVQAEGCAPAIRLGFQYDLSFWYRSTQKATVTLFRKVPSQGWVPWMKVAALEPSGKYLRAKARTPVVTPDSTHLRYGITLDGPGTLLTDDYTMSPVRPEGMPDASAMRAAACKPGSGAACRKGSWIKVQRIPKVRSIHAVLLHTGKVLLIGGSGNNKRLFEAKKFTTQVLDPKTGKITKNVTTPRDFFCAGHVQLPDGKVLVMGGTAAYEKAGPNRNGFKGLRTSYIFDPVKEVYKPADSMQQAHWYPSATADGDGNVYSFGGWQDTDGQAIASTSTEFFNAKTKRWADDTEQQYKWGTYPGMILMSDGKLFYTGSYVFDAPRLVAADQNTPAVFDPATGGVEPVPGLRRTWQRDQAMSLLLPPAQDQRVITMGGGDGDGRSVDTGDGFGQYNANKITPPPAHHLTDLIDLDGDRTYHKSQDLPKGKVEKIIGGKNRWVPQTGTEGKMYVSAVILPDGQVLETGGAQENRKTAVREASLYNPATGKFTKGLATDKIRRTYHSMAILLPDGRVMTVGENPYVMPDRNDSEDANFNRQISVFKPPYLFKKNRPTIKKLSTKVWKRGGTYKVTTSGPIGSAALIRPAAVTHSSDPNQRYIRLNITRNGKTPRLTLDRRKNITPPGWYMLFVTNPQGVPSAAKWVKVT